MRGNRAVNVRWLLAACVAAAVSGAACDRRQMAAADGKLIVLPSEIDFARVPMYGGADHTLTLRNIGRGHIRVEEVWVENTDGKTYVPEFNHEGPHALKPSDTCELVVKFRPEKEGVQPALLVLRSDHPDEPLTKIPLTGEGVDARAEVSAGALDFGRIEAQAKKTLQLTFRNISDLDIEVGNTLIGRDQDEFTVPSFPLGPYEERKVDVTFAPQRVGVKDSGIVVEPCKRCPTEQVAIAAEALDRAIVPEPWELDFGQVAMDQHAALPSRLRNISTEPMEIRAKRLTDDTDVSFTTSPAALPMMLGPGEVAEFEVQYTPGHMGPADGRLVFDVTSVRNPTTEVPVRGFGGAAEICVSPSSYDFGVVPVGSKNGTTVKLKNCGTSNEAPLEIRSLRFGGDGIRGEDQYSFEGPPMPVQLAAGEEIEVRVFYEPTRDGAAGGYLHVETSLFGLEDLRVGFNGEGRTSTDCRVEITPLEVDFGTVTPGGGAVLGVKVRNDGTDVCAVKNIKLNDDGGGVFGMPGGEIDGLLLYVGDYFTFMVSFRPPEAGGSFAGILQIESADPDNPRTLIPVVGNSQESCLVAAPRYVDFGVARPDCPPPPQEVNLSNQCAQPLDLRRVEVGPGTTDGEFELESTSRTLPQTLQPGESVTVSIRYHAQVPGLNLAPLYADVVGLAAPQLVPLVGESSKHAERTDRFTQQDGSKVDLLFVVDNTASMVEEQPKFISALPAFVDTALSRGVDLHVAVTTTGIAEASGACPGGAMGGEAGRFFPADNSNQRQFTHASPNLAAELQQNAAVGQCANVEQGLEAMRRALTDPLVSSADDPRTGLPNDGNAGFLRDEAALAVVFVGDEDDHSPDAVETYVEFLHDLKGRHQPNRVVIYAIAPSDQVCSTAGGTGTRYQDAAARTGGEVLDICADDYSPLLRSVAEQSFGPQDRFPLSATPDGSGFTVTIDGVGVTTGWRYDSAANAIVFDTMPAPGSEIVIRYRKAC